MSGLNVAAGLLALVLALSQTERTHVVGTVAAWVLFLGAMVLRGVGIGS